MPRTPIAVTIVEAMELLHCSRAMVFRLLASEEIDRAQSAGKTKLILYQSLVDYLTAPQRTPAAKRRRSKRQHAPPPAASLSDLR